jgi:hypothetical protein
VRLTRMPASPSLTVLFTLGVLIGSSCLGYSDDRPSDRAVRRARTFLDTADNGRYVLGFVHMGARYEGNAYSTTLKVTTRSGETLDGHFALVYDYSWESDGNTQIAFLCDPRGDIYDVRILRTNAVLSQPYAVAKLSIDLLGNTLLEAFKSDLKESDRAKLQTIIRDCDPEAMLKLGLKLRQLFAR